MLLAAALVLFEGDDIAAEISRATQAKPVPATGRVSLVLVRLSPLFPFLRTGAKDTKKST
jgi:hypothetical protein